MVEAISPPYAVNPIDSRTGHPGTVQDDPTLAQKDTKGQPANVNKVGQGAKVVRPTVAVEIHLETAHGPKDPPTALSNADLTPTDNSKTVSTLALTTFILIASPHQSLKMLTNNRNKPHMDTLHSTQPYNPSPKQAQDP